MFEESRHVVYLGLGSNLGDREANIAAGLQRLRPDVETTRLSSLYETEPAYVADQPRFLNLAARGTTTLDPHGLLRRIKKVESEMGRTATVRYGPRPIDIDILFFDDLVISSEALTVPHPLLAERGFVLVPLAEIAPEVRHPVVGATVSQLLARLSRTDDVVTLGRTLATAGRS